MPEEQPPPGTHCVVEECASPATVYVDVAMGDEIDGPKDVPMCDEHAVHWQD